MAINFKDFNFDQQSKKDNNSTTQADTKTVQNDTKTTQNDTKNYENLINKYKQMDNGSLMNELISQASSLKQQGKLNNESLNQLQNILTPMLNDEQKQMLQNLLEVLK